MGAGVQRCGTDSNAGGGYCAIASIMLGSQRITPAAFRQYPSWFHPGARINTTRPDRSRANRSCGRVRSLRSVLNTAHPPSSFSAAIQSISAKPHRNRSGMLIAVPPSGCNKACTAPARDGGRFSSSASFTPQASSQMQRPAARRPQLYRILPPPWRYRRAPRSARQREWRSVPPAQRSGARRIGTD
jgi:hypothetical protein